MSSFLQPEAKSNEMPRMPKENRHPARRSAGRAEIRLHCFKDICFKVSVFTLRCLPRTGKPLFAYSLTKFDCFCDGPFEVKLPDLDSRYTKPREQVLPISL